MKPLPSAVLPTAFLSTAFYMAAFFTAGGITAQGASPRPAPQVVSDSATSKVTVGVPAAPIPAPQDPIQEGAEDDTETLMKAIHRHFRMIGRFLRRPEGEAPLDDVVAMQTLALKAKMTMPSLAATLPEGERPAFLAAYRKDMNQFLRQLLDLEDAMAAEEWDKAAEIGKSLNENKKLGHKAYKDGDK